MYNIPGMKTIILASASPRRKEILEKTGLRFTVDASGHEEVVHAVMSPRQYVRRLSREKAEMAAKKYRDAIIIAADTVVVVNGTILGKPCNAEEAKKMLRTLNGKAHTVITGFTVLGPETRRKVSRSVETTVYFKRMTLEEIDTYIRTGEPLDKAGGYAIQGLGAVFIKKIDGDYFNVMGLPLCALVDALKKFGISVL
jgi:septum formation protein